MSGKVNNVPCNSTGDKEDNMPDAWGGGEKENLQGQELVHYISG